MTAPGLIPHTPQGSRGFARRAAGPALSRLLLLPLLLGVGDPAHAGAQAAAAASAPDGGRFAVAPSVETDPIPKGFDELDDPALWVHATDPARSRLLGTIKQLGLVVYDLAGRQLARLDGGRLNNVDLRYGFELAGGPFALALATNTETGKGHVAAYLIDEAGAVSSYDLALIAPDPPLVGSVYGLCMYRSAATNDLFVFFTSTEDEVQQWRLRPVNGAIEAAPMRHFTTPSLAEGCVADDEHGVLYVSVEDAGIYAFDAEPDAPANGTLIAPIKKAGGWLKPDIEGLALYRTPGGGGYLLASSQGSSEYVAFERTGQHAFVGRFRITKSGSIDKVTKTDGIEVISAPLGSAFPLGVFVAQDDKNSGGQQNFKLVPWERIANGAQPPLTIDAGQDPRQ